MYTLIGAKVVTRMELEEYYDLDDFIKAYSLWQMQQDIQAVQSNELKNKLEKR